MKSPGVPILSEPTATAVEREARSKEVNFITEQRASLAVVGEELYIVTAICSSAEIPFSAPF